MQYICSRIAFASIFHSLLVIAAEQREVSLIGRNRLSKELE
jgi:hypothetical protein